MITPTVGRVVWYWPRVNKVFAPGEQPLAAIIAEVLADACINIAYFSSNGTAQSATSVLLLQDDEPRPALGGFCEWMPYQKGQAAKTEALEAKMVA